MKLKRLALAASVAMATMAFTVAAASATMLEVNGVTQNKSVSFSISLKSGTSMVLGTTSGVSAATCTVSNLAGSTTTYSGVQVGGPLSVVTFSSCSAGSFQVHKAGSLTIERIGSSTNGTVRWVGAEITVPGFLGFTATCTTGSGIDLGTLTGVASGNAVLDVNAVMNCGFLAPSTFFNGTYTVTSPAGLGVSS